MAELNVELRAKVARLKSDLKQAEVAFKKTGQKADILSNKVGKTGVKSMRTFAKSTKANATPAMLEFSRVVQDAPFGIQGVANNIQQLTANFGNLSKKSGGAKAALKLMIGTLSGPAGILLAISAVTALMVAFGDKLKFSKDKAEDLNSELEKLNKNFELELEGSDLLVENAKLQGLEYKEILKTRIDILKKQLEGVVALIDQRKQLLLINKASQETVGNFEAISQSAVITAGALVVSATRGLGDAFDEQLDFIGKIATGLKDVLGIEIDKNFVVTSTKKERAAEKKLTEDLKRLDNERLGIINQILKSQKNVTKATSEVPSIYFDLGEIFKVDSSKLTGVFVDPVKEELKRLGLLLDRQPTLIGPKLTNIQIKFQEFGDRMASQTLDLASAVSGGFSELGRSLASGAGLLDSAGKAILSFMGSILTQLGQASIAAGVAAIALENLFSNPYTAIAAGAVLVALGSALSSAHSSVSGIGSSSGSVAGQGSGSTSSGGSSSTFVGGSSGYGEVVFRIGGQELIGVLSRVSNKNQRFGLNG